MNYKKDFPFFTNHPACIYADSAATSQKPQSVIDALVTWYTRYNANAQRGIYQLAEQATEKIAIVRQHIAHFINAHDKDEIIFTQGTTDSINKVALLWADHVLQKNDEIVITQLEHHANLVPWQQLAARKGLKLSIIPVQQDGTLPYHALDQYFSKRTKLLAVGHVSNALGTYHDIHQLVAVAKKYSAYVLVDGAQAVGYMPVDVQALGCDFYTFSGHKMLGPTGIGILYVRRSVLEQMQPAFYGGSAVYSVDETSTTFAAPPYCFEPGTLPLAEIWGLHAAVEYLEKIGLDRIQHHCSELTQRALAGLQKIPTITVLGPLQQLQHKGHLISFVPHSLHAHDVAALLDQYGICVRAGHQCAQPLGTALGYNSSVRLSFHVYTTADDIDKILAALKEIVRP